MSGITLDVLNGDNDIPYYFVWNKLNGLIHIKHWERILIHTRRSLNVSLCDKNDNDYGNSTADNDG